MYRVKLTTYPGNETRAVFARLPPSKPFDITNESSPCQCPVDAESQTANQNVLVNSPLLDSRCKVGHPGRPVENSDNPGWGGLPKPSRFGLNAKRKLARAGGLLDEVVSHPSEVLFLTGTVPNGYDDGKITTAAYSAFIVYTLKKWVSRTVPDKWDMYVWEYQKRGALHLHYAVWVPKTDDRAYLQEHFHEKWCNILLSIYHQTGVDLCASANGYTDRHNTAYIQAYAQEVYKSVGAYLAKYVGKDAGKSGVCGDKVLYPPSRWWGVSRPLTKAVRESTVEHEVLGISQRRVLTLYQDVATMLSSQSEEAHEYQSRYSYALTTVAYRTSIIGTEECQLMMQNPRSTSKPKNSQKTSVRIHTRLKVILRTFSLTPHIYSTQYTASSALAVERLFNGAQLNIIEAMEILDGIQWLLYWKYQRLSRRHESLEESLSQQAAMKATLYRRMRETQQPITAPLSSLD